MEPFGMQGRAGSLWIKDALMASWVCGLNRGLWRRPRKMLGKAEVWQRQVGANKILCCSLQMCKREHFGSQRIILGQGAPDLVPPAVQSRPKDRSRLAQFSNSGGRVAGGIRFQSLHGTRTTFATSGTSAPFTGPPGELRAGPPAQAAIPSGCAASGPVAKEGLKKRVGPLPT